MNKSANLKFLLITFSLLTIKTASNIISSQTKEPIELATKDKVPGDKKALTGLEHKIKIKSIKSGEPITKALVVLFLLLVCSFIFNSYYFTING